MNVMTRNGREFHDFTQTSNATGYGAGRERYNKLDLDARLRARYIDKLSRKLFPLAFLSFNLVYWLAYILA